MKINKNSRQQFWQRGNGKPFLINIKENKRQAIFEIKSIFAISRNTSLIPILLNVFFLVIPICHKLFPKKKHQSLENFM